MIAITIFIWSRLILMRRGPFEPGSHRGEGGVARRFEPYKARAMTFDVNQIF
jgi:hypothetical protein